MISGSAAISGTAMSASPPERRRGRGSGRGKGRLGTAEWYGWGVVTGRIATGLGEQVEARFGERTRALGRWLDEH